MELKIDEDHCGPMDRQDTEAELRSPVGRTAGGYEKTQRSKNGILICPLYRRGEVLSEERKEE